MVRVSEHVPDALRCSCLALSGSMLLCSGGCKDDRSGFLVVLDSDTFSCQHTLRLDLPCYRLLSMRGEVWSTGSGKVVVWGKAERGERSGLSEAGRS